VRGIYKKKHGEVEHIDQDDIGKGRDPSGVRKKYVVDLKNTGSGEMLNNKLTVWGVHATLQSRPKTG
jgi:hypothetical protein